MAAHHPEAFHSHTHLIIDEIHERSVDTDLLCYMTRRLLEMHPRLKLVVMSATLNTATYANYFGIPEDEFLFGKKPPFFTQSWLQELRKELWKELREELREELQARTSACKC